MTEEKEEPATVLAGCLLLIVMLPIGIIIRGFVLKTLWLWFLVPLGLPPISFGLAWGLSIITAMFTHQHSSKTTGKKMSTIVGTAIGVDFLGPFLALFAGWLATLFM
jgi:hypothetical protein